MAIDQTSPTSTPSPPPVPAIENEFPTYRAISSKAVLSLVFGLGSVFCFADLWFLLTVAVAVAFGLVALKNIREFPEILTGAGLARVGIGVALLFGLSALTQMITQEVTINIDAGQFARSYVEVLKNEPASVALWYQQSPAYRREKNPDELVEELKKAKGPQSGDPYQTKYEPIQKIKSRIKEPGGQLSYSQVETKAIDGLTTYANALLKIEGSGTKDHPENEEYILLQMVRGRDAGRLEWMIQELKYPYTPRSAVATIEKKDDDGHGHAGGH